MRVPQTPAGPGKHPTPSLAIRVLPFISRAPLWTGSYTAAPHKNRRAFPSPGERPRQQAQDALDRWSRRTFGKVNEMNCFRFSPFSELGYHPPGSSRRPGWRPTHSGPSSAQPYRSCLQRSMPFVSETYREGASQASRPLSSLPRGPPTHRRHPACPVVTSSQHHDRVTVDLSRDEDLLLVSEGGGSRVQMRVQE